MFETAELGRSTSRSEYLKQEPALRVGLLTVQYELRDADFPVVLVLAGNDRLGCIEVLNLLHEWMDARYLEANVFEAPTDEEQDHNGGLSQPRPVERVRAGGGRDGPADQH